MWGWGNLSRALARLGVRLVLTSILKCIRTEGLLILSYSCSGYRPKGSWGSTDERTRRRQAYKPEKGKPPEKVGRKTTGLSPEMVWDMVAGSPGEHSASFKLCFANTLDGGVE